MEFFFEKPEFSTVESGTPVLVGHIFKKFTENYGSEREILEWVNNQNKINDFKTVTFAYIKKYKAHYRIRKSQKKRVNRLCFVIAGYTARVWEPPTGSILANVLLMKNEPKPRVFDGPEYSTVESGTPVLVGHIFKKFKENYGTCREILEWVNNQNKINGFKTVSFPFIKKYKAYYYRKWANSLCSVIAGYTSKVWIPPTSPTTSTMETDPLTQNESKPLENELLEKHEELKEKNQLIQAETTKKSIYPTLSKLIEKQKKLREQNQFLQTQKNKKLIHPKRLEKQKKFKEKIQLIQTQKPINPISIRKKKSLRTRKLSYISLLSGVSMNKTPSLITNLSNFLGLRLDEFSNSSVRRMGWELSFFADYLTCTALLNIDTATLIFDAIIQEEAYIGCILLSTPTSSYLVSLEQLPGLTTFDYKEYINSNMKRLAKIYSLISEEDFDYCFKNLTNKISYTLTERSAEKHDTLKSLEKEWRKQLVELNCNLRPLESISKSCRKALTDWENCKSNDLFPQNECLAWRIIWGLNKLSFSEEEEDSSDFSLFWQNKGIKKGSLPRFCGNRLHIIFHLSGIYYTHFEDIKKCLQKFTTPNEVQKDLQQAFEEKLAKIELQALGVIGKLLTGPWMQHFYTDKVNQDDANDSNNTVKLVMGQIKVCIDHPDKIFTLKKDFFGDPLDFDNDIVKNLMETPQDPVLSIVVIKTCLEAILKIFHIQYNHTFSTVVSERLKVISAVTEHTMVAESIFGDFSKHRILAPFAKVSCISNLIKAQRNGVKEFLINTNRTKLNALFNIAISKGRFEHLKQINLEVETLNEIERRFEARRLSRRMYEKVLKKQLDTSFEALRKRLPIITTDRLVLLQEILNGCPRSKSIEHYWTIGNTFKRYYAEIKSFENNNYTIFYYKPEGNVENGKIEEVSAVDLAADFLSTDLTFR